VTASRSFVAGGIAARSASKLHDAARKTFYQDEFASAPGLLQSLDPRAKIIGLGALVVGASSSGRLNCLCGLFLFGVALAIASRIPVPVLATRAWAGVFLITGVLAGPALFTISGDTLFRLPLGLTITSQGLRTAALLLVRIETAATFSALLVLSTPWMHLLKGLRVLRVPVVVVVLLSLTCRYIVLLLQTAQEMFEARESRRVGGLSGKQQRQIAASAGGVLLTKTMWLSEEVYLAMRSRGYRGEVFLLDSFRMRMRDWAAVTVLPAIACLPLWFR
jgi:cobalt/nickel transport system permease protein